MAHLPGPFSCNNKSQLPAIPVEAMHAGVATIYQQQKAIGYESTFVEGPTDSSRYMKGLFSDWQAEGITSVLHEKRGGYANNMASLRGLLKPCYLYSPTTAFRRLLMELFPPKTGVSGIE